MTRDQWRAVYRERPDLRERIKAAADATTADEFSVWLTLEEAGEDEALIDAAVDWIEESFRKTRGVIFSRNGDSGITRLSRTLLASVI